MSEKKIYIKEEEGIEEVLKRIKKSGAERIVLHLPEKSKLKSSLDNFHAIKRESIIENIEVVVESLDSFILELAALAKIKAINPLFGEEEKVFSDIIPKNSPDGEERKGPGVSEKNKEREGVDDESEKGEEEDKYDFLKAAIKNKKKERHVGKKSETIVRSKRFKISLVFTLFFILTAGVIAFNVLPSATITIDLKRTEVEVSERVLVGTEAGSLDSESADIVLPGQIIFGEKNLDLSFPASGSDFIEQRAQGDIYIYNIFSTADVPLVERTRFISPEGKIYRTMERVTVPGANEENGELIPSRIRVTLVADEPGDEYNTDTEPDETWNIPGFQESGMMDFYNGMYGVPITSFSGGFIGETFLPTEEDMTMAEEKAEESLYNALIVELDIISSSNLEFLTESREMNVLERSIDRIADERGDFNVFMDAEMRAFAIEKEALEKALIDKMFFDNERAENNLSEGFEIVESNIEYENMSIDWESGELMFLATGTMIIKPAVNEEYFVSRMLGKKESEIREVIFSIPDVSSVNISLWPRWVKKIPDKPERVDVFID